MYKYQENFLVCSALHGCNIVAEDDFGWPHECSHNKILFLYYYYDIKNNINNNNDNDNDNTPSPTPLTRLIAPTVIFFSGALARILCVVMYFHI